MPIMKQSEKTGLKFEPIDEAEETLVVQISTVLNKEQPIREKVFRRLQEMQRDDLAQAPANNIQNASSLAIWPNTSDISTIEAKKKALETIRAEINGLQFESKQNKAKATKLMTNVVLYAKRIGDRLLYAKWHLLKHSEYEAWVAKNFDGGVSTARVYTRIAKLENWKKIAPKLHKGQLTLEQALAIIRGKPEKEKLDSRTKMLRKMLLGQFHRQIKTWPDKALSHLAHDFKLMPLITAAAEERYQEIRRFISASEKGSAIKRQYTDTRKVLYERLLLAERIEL